MRYSLDSGRFAAGGARYQCPQRPVVARVLVVATLDFAGLNLPAGFWVLGLGLWVLGFGFWVLGFGFWVEVLGLNP